MTQTTCLFCIGVSQESNKFIYGIMLLFFITGKKRKKNPNNVASVCLKICAMSNKIDIQPLCLIHVLMTNTYTHTHTHALAHIHTHIMHIIHTHTYICTNIHICTHMCTTITPHPSTHTHTHTAQTVSHDNVCQPHHHHPNMHIHLLFKEFNQFFIDTNHVFLWNLSRILGMHCAKSLKKTADDATKYTQVRQGYMYKLN